MALKKIWGLTKEDFLKETRIGHPRKRERWLAIMWLFEGVSQAEVARRLKRTRETIQIWKENFEENGPSSLEFKRSGDQKPLLSPDEQQSFAAVVATTRPCEVGIDGIRWTLPLMVHYCRRQFGKKLSKETCRRILHNNNVVVKRPKKN